MIVNLKRPKGAFLAWTQANSFVWHLRMIYRQTSNISRTLVGNTMFDHSAVVGASPVGGVPTTSSFST